jgi:glycosyltransferase involved in cell wall biosynthesis
MKIEPNILIVVNSLTGGGAEKSSVQLFNYLRKKNYSVFLYAINKVSPTPGVLKLKRDANIIEMERSNKAKLIPTIVSYLQFIRQVKKIQPFIVIANCELPEMFASLTPYFYFHIIAVEHTSRPWDGRRFLGVIIRIILSARSTRWITVNSNQIKIWPFLKYSKFIPNAVDLDDIRQTKGPNKLLNPEIYFIGRINKIKRPEWVIDAAISLNNQVNIYGDGPNLEGLSEKYKLYKNIKFHGYVEDVWSRITQNDLIVVPSEYEGDGLVVAEGIVNNCKILLIDNADMRRFGLPEDNYFINLEELKSKINKWVVSGFTEFKVPDSIHNKYILNRNINHIGKEWKDLLDEF